MAEEKKMFIPIPKVYEATNNGLQILIDLFPGSDVEKSANKKEKIKVRDEKTKSALIVQDKNGIWCLQDFGVDLRPVNAISTYMAERGLEIHDALTELAAKYGITGESGKSIGATYSKRKAKKKEVNGSLVDIQKLEWTETLLSVLGKYGTEEAAEFLNCSPIKSYGRVSKGEVHLWESSDFYPMFIYEYEHFSVIYQPYADKKYRFQYAGPKAKNIIFGLDKAKAAFNRRKTETTDESETKDSTGKEIDGLELKTQKELDPRLEAIFIVSGQSDAFNLRSHSKHYFPIWFGSESMTLNWETYNTLTTIAKNIYNISDLDSTGQRQKLRTSILYPSIRNVELPQWLLDKKDHRGNPCKDLKDYFQHCNAKKQFDYLVKDALSLKFWVEQINHRTGAVKYDCSNLNLYLWLNAHGFQRIPAPHLKEKYEYIQVKGNVVKRVDYTDIADFVYQYFSNTRVPAYDTVKLRNSFFRTPQLNETSLRKISKTHIDFEHSSAADQWFFFRNKTISITASKIEEHKTADVKKYVWEDHIKDHNIRLEEKPLFNAEKDEEGNWNLSISDKLKENIFFKYLWNTCRVYWQKEEKGTPLTPEEKAEHQLHFINKCYALGYFLHGYKSPSRSFCIFSLDAKESELAEHAGGTGKSILAFSTNHLIENIDFDGQDPKLFDDKHLFAHVQDRTRGLIFDDTQRFFSFHRLLKKVTGPFDIRPVGGQTRTIEAKYAPKMWFTSNHGPRDMDGSKERRIIYTGTSDYYHHKGDKHDTSRSPATEFKRELFDDFTTEEWNLWYNLMFQCVQFYMNQPEAIQPPMGEINKRAHLEIIGIPFMEWAESHMVDKSRLNIEVSKTELIDKYKEDHPKDRFPITSTTFKKKLKAWCKYKGYIFNPKELCTDDKGRIQANVGGKTTEMIFIRTKLDDSVAKSQILQ